MPFRDHCRSLAVVVNCYPYEAWVAGLKKKLTDRAVKLLRPRSDRYEVWDTDYPGFGVRVSPAGRKSFVYLYRFEGRPRRMTLGVYHRVSLATARARYGKARELLDKKGRDPGAEQIDTKRARRDAPTVEDLADNYIERWAKPRKRSWKEDERKLKQDVCPVIGRKKAEAVTRRDIRDVLDAVMDRGAPIAANRTLAVMRKMFRWGVSVDLLPHNPCEAIQAPAEEKQRDRVLDEDEIKTLWGHLDGNDISMDPNIRLCLKLMLVTAQRRTEVATARWADVDLATGWWVIPEGVVKNKRPHRVPLSPLAIRLLKTAKKELGGSEYVFPNLSGDDSVRPESISKAVPRNVAALTIAYFRSHDLRRTAATQMASMGTPCSTIGKVLNHSEGGVTAIYNRYSYDVEKRKALNAWSRKLESIIRGKKAKVIEFKTG